MTPLLVIAQVTIGAAIQPADGVLLDLKQYDSAEKGGPTADKGLLLPRVALTDLNKLYPMFSEDDPEYTGANMLKQNALHEGLLAFNIKKTSTDIPDGLYFWDGSKWKALFDIPQEDDSNIIRDHENNDYLIGDFGNAGWWTLQNMRTKTLPNGYVIPFSKEVDKDDPNKATLVRVFYPDGEPNTEENPHTHDEKNMECYILDPLLLLKS